MRTFLGAIAVVVLVVGGSWFALSQLVGPAHNGTDAYTRSAACAGSDPSLSRDSKDAARIATTWLSTLGLGWKGFRAVALFAKSSRIARQTEMRLAAGLRKQGASSTEIAGRVLRERYVVLFYVNASPTQAAEAAFGRCIYLIRANRFASFFGLNLTHTERPFLPGAERGR
jgi:hypothetical protein